MEEKKAAEISPGSNKLLSDDEANLHRRLTRRHRHMWPHLKRRPTSREKNPDLGTARNEEFPERWVSFGYRLASSQWRLQGGGYRAAIRTATSDVAGLQTGAETGEEVLKHAIDGNPVLDLADGIENGCVIAVAKKAAHFLKGMIGVLASQEHADLSG